MKSLKPMQGFARQLGLLATVLTLAACSGSIKPVVHKPSPLVDLSTTAQQLQNQILQPIWQKDIGAGSGSTELTMQPVFDGTNYYMANHAGELFAVSNTGQIRWQKKSPLLIAAGVAIAKPNSTRTLVVSHNKGQLTALDTETGAKRWQVQLTGSVLAPVLIHHNVVVAHSNDGVVTGIEVMTGKTIWQFTTKTAEMSLRSKAKPVLLDDNTVLIATGDGRIHVVNIDSGVPLWSRRIGVGSGKPDAINLTDVIAEPLVNNNKLYVASYSGQFVAFELTTDKLLFVNNEATSVGLAADNQQAYIVNLTSQLKAVDATSGRLIWQQNALQYRQLSNPVRMGNYLLVGDLAGYLHVLDPSTGALVTRMRVAKNAIKQLNVQADKLLIQSQAGEVSVWQLLNHES